tara:strand:- start:3294 stop:3575 length:282 start_codon:yes stop_codon:yes gene_type:complete
MKANIRELKKEVGVINWKELERFFASGKLIIINDDLDIIDVAYKFNIDDSDLISSWIESDKLGFVTDEQAKSWSKVNKEFTCIVVAPWVLIQK